jgi:hypothetical protein
MASPYPSTAEQVVGAVEAAFVSATPVDAAIVASFADITAARARSALAMAADLGLLAEANESFSVASPLAAFLSTARPDISMAALRVALETHPAFRLFRSRLAQGADGSTAARHTKATLALEGHRDEIRDTLVDLGTYTHALEVVGGGQFRAHTEPALNALQVLAEASDDSAAATARIEAQLGDAALEHASSAEVIEPLADALQRAGQGDAAGAVQQGGNAVEAYLVGVAGRMSVNIAGAHGINAKVDRMSQQAALPSKLMNVSKYLGHVRNAADHGPDAEVNNSSWRIRANTGTEYVFVACSFLASLADWERGAAPTL